MTYREMLELYKRCELDEAQMKKVRADIERQDAISDYLYEESEIPDFNTKPEHGHGQEDTGIENEASEMKSFEKVELAEKQFAALVKKSIRRAFIKLGAVILVLTLVIVLFIQFALPELVSERYYNPGEEAAENTNRISLDLAAYTELMIPGYYRDTVAVDANGYGDYDIFIQQNVSYTGTFTNLAGKIKKGKLNLYDRNVLNAPPVNTFGWFQMQGDTTKSLREQEEEGRQVFSIVGNREDAAEALKELSNTQDYMGYVTLDRMMSYGELMEFMDREEIGPAAWCAVVTEPYEDDGMFQTENLGFQCSLSKCSVLNWDREKYPNLIVWDQESDAKTENPMELIEDEAYMTTHFISLLRYLSEQEEFLDMMEVVPADLSDAAKYVEENGITVYGFAVLLDKEEALRLHELDEVYEVYTCPVR